MTHFLYRLLNASELSALESQVAAACGKWSLAWLAADVHSTVRCFRAAEHDAAILEEKTGWMAVGTGPAHWVAVRSSAALHAPLRGMLIAGVAGNEAGAKPSGLLVALAERALADLLEALAGEDAARLHEPFAPEQSLHAPGSGAAVAEIACGECRITLLISPHQAASMLAGLTAAAPAKIAFENRRDALANGRIALTVAIGETQLEIGLLQTIVAGDVIRLNTRIDQPLAVMTADGVRLCSAFLGSREGHKSVQLTSPTISGE
ncbi:MAG: FliM/FliN family flagellar motor C-terminal domain-containing protein [Pseudomonadota bacterium]